MIRLFQCKRPDGSVFFFDAPDWEGAKDFLARIGERYIELIDTTKGEAGYMPSIRMR